jgi:hypothetical protein
MTSTRETGNLETLGYVQDRNSQLAQGSFIRIESFDCLRVFKQAQECACKPFAFNVGFGPF